MIQAFLNVAKNAAEALGQQPDGEIAFITLSPRREIPRGRQRRARALLEVQIVDNGPGLHADVADRLFEPFATTKPGGMGLGLNVAADIIARHDGRIEVESRPGRTAFNIFLPIDSEDTP